MPRPTRSYRCSECGRETAGFVGRCPGCQAWNTMAPAIIPSLKPGRVTQTASQPLAAIPLSEVPDEPGRRLRTDIPEFDRVLGGGIVPGSLILVGGDPGIGKSTLMLQAAASVAATGGAVAYICGEESPRQVRLRASRLGLAGTGVSLVPETGLDAALASAEALAPALVIVDSIQSVYVEGVESRLGGPAQLAEAGSRLVDWAKSRDIAVVVTGHVTKGGDIAGPRLLEHLVDAVLYFEGAEGGAFRILRAVKNRFGATDEVGVFEMTGEGLRSVENPASAFIDQAAPHASGCAVTAVIEGSRPIAVEIQALAVPSYLSAPRRVAAGIEVSRLHLLLAVLARRAGLNASGLDVVASVSAGLRLRDPSADLAAIVALASAIKDRPLPDRTAYLGEVALSGAVRAVQQPARRLQELARLGFRRCLVPASHDGPLDGLEVVRVATVGQALDVVLG